MLQHLNNITTPCFVLDEAEMAKSIQNFRDALSDKFSNAIVAYSVKTNSLPYGIVCALKYGCYAEVVSDDELSLALKCGYDYKNIIFNGPMKSKYAFIKSIKAGAIVNIETHREIEWLTELPKNKIWNIGIRLSVNISKISPSDADGEDDYSRFGFTDETFEFHDVIKKIGLIPQVRLSGIHVHRTSHTRSIEFYKNLAEYAAETITKYNLNLDYIDIGGGFYGIFKNAPSFNEYTDAIYKSLNKYNLGHLKIIVEPGNALTASAYSYYSSVIDTKQLKDRRIITTDGSRNDIDPFFRKTSYIKEIIRIDNCRENIPSQVIAGATCLEYDKLFEITDAPEIKTGDIIKYNNVGAYTLTLTPLFINYFPRVYSLNGEELKLVRDKWTANEFINKSTLE